MKEVRVNLVDSPGNKWKAFSIPPSSAYPSEFRGRIGMIISESEMIMPMRPRVGVRARVLIFEGRVQWTDSSL